MTTGCRTWVAWAASWALLGCTEVVDLGSNGVCGPQTETCRRQPETCAPPTLSDALPVGRDVPTRAASNQAYPVAAFDGTNHLVVWQDFRSNSFGLLRTLMNQDGQPLGRARRLDVRSVSEPRVAYLDGIYLVVFRQGVFNQESNIFALRLNREGDALDPQPIALSSDLQWEDSVTVSAAQGRFVIAWVSDDKVLRTRTIGLDGVPDARGPVPVVTEADRVALASDGTSHLLVYTQQTPQQMTSPLPMLHVQRLAADGTALGSAVPVTTPVARINEVAATWDGTQFLAVWTDIRSTYHTDAGVTFVSQLYASRVTSAGVVLDPDGVVLSSSPSGKYKYHAHASVSASSEGVVAAWVEVEWRDFFDARLAGSTRLAGDAGPWLDAVHLAQVSYTPITLVAGTSQLVLLFSQGGDLLSLRLTRQGVLVSPEPTIVSVVANTQSRPSVASVSGEYVVTWTEPVAEPEPTDTPVLRRHWYAWLPWDGGAAGPDEAVPSDARWSNRTLVAGSDHEALMVWQETYAARPAALLGLRLHGSSQPVVGPFSFATPPMVQGVLAPCFEAEAPHWWVAWPGDSGWFTQRLDASGALAAAPIEVPLVNADRHGGWVGDGRQCRLFFRQNGQQVMMARPGALGALDAQAVDGLSLPSSASSAIAGHDGVWLLAWLEGGLLRWARVDADGTLLGLGGPSDVLGADSPRTVALVAHEGGFLVLALTAPERSLRLVGARLDREGRQVGSRFELASGVWVNDAEVAPGPPGEFLVTYEVLDEALLTTRMRARVLRQKAEGGACREDADCASAHCRSSGRYAVGCRVAEGWWPWVGLLGLRLRRRSTTPAAS